MERRIGTVSRGVRAPIIREGDDLVSIVTDSVLEAAKSEGFELRDRDIIAVTEAVVARAQGNYVTILPINGCFTWFSIATTIVLSILLLTTLPTRVFLRFLSTTDNLLSNYDSSHASACVITWAGTALSRSAQSYDIDIS